MPSSTLLLLSLLLLLTLSTSLHPPAPRLLIFGLGYTGTHLTTTLPKDFFGDVAATTTSGVATRCPDFLGAVHQYAYDAPPSPALLADLRSSTHVLVTAPPPPLPFMNPLPSFLSDPSLTNLTSITFLSTTGVYGDHAGQWVDEDSDCLATEEKKEKYLYTEADFVEKVGGRVAVNILRLAGMYVGSGLCSHRVHPVNTVSLFPSISPPPRLTPLPLPLPPPSYGPGRSSLHTSLASLASLPNSPPPPPPETPLPPEDPTSRVHVTDVCRAISAKMDIDWKNRDATYQDPYVLNCADSHPSTRTESFTYAAELLKIPVVPPKRTGRKGGRKRVRSDKIVELLGELKYPSYREGLKSVYEGEFGEGEKERV